uniref:Calponin-homology (CH) domain-containing protein n=1 Tax=Steinernema glaseri TaxID=37863 RepID=A0A1I8AAB0_9BILA
MSRAAEEEARENVLPETLPDAAWKKIQQNTFTRWVNQHLACINLSINNLASDFHDGLKLIGLVEVLATRSLGKYNKRVSFRSQKLENVTLVLKFLENDEDVKLVNIDSSDIVDENLKLIMGLVWTLIQHYSISMPVWTDGDKAKESNTTNSPRARLLAWIKAHLPEDVPVTNFSSDWNDGVALGALVDHCCGGLIDLDWRNFDPRDADSNTAHVMKIAAERLDVAGLITAEELINPNVDEQSVMTYLSQFPRAHAAYIERKQKEDEERRVREEIERHESLIAEQLEEQRRLSREAEEQRQREEEEQRLREEEAERKRREAEEKERLLAEAAEAERLRAAAEEEERLRRLREEEEARVKEQERINVEKRLLELEEERRRLELEEEQRRLQLEEEIKREQELEAQNRILREQEEERLREEEERKRRLHQDEVRTVTHIEVDDEESVSRKLSEILKKSEEHRTVPFDKTCESDEEPGVVCTAASTDSTCSSCHSECEVCDHQQLPKGNDTNVLKQQGEMPTETRQQESHNGDDNHCPNHLRCFAEGPGLTHAYVNEPTWFEVNTQNSDRPGHLQFRLAGPHETQTSVKDHSDGCCTFEYTALSPGQYIVDVLYADVDLTNEETEPQHIPGSPFHVTVEERSNGCPINDSANKSNGISFANNCPPRVRQAIKGSALDCYHNICLDRRRNIRPSRNVHASEDQPVEDQTEDLERYAFVHQNGGEKRPKEVSVLVNLVENISVQDLTPFVTMPSGAHTQNAQIIDNHDGTVLVKYQPSQQGKHELTIQHNGHNLKGAPIVFYVDDIKNGFITVYGPGLQYAVVGEPAAFTVCAAGGIKTDLVVSIEGNGKANVQSHDNKDGTCSVTWVPPVPGEYLISVKVAGKLVKGGPFKVLVAGEGHKRAHLSVGSTSEVSLNIIEPSLKGISASIKSPQGIEEPCFIRHIDATHIGVSFTPREVGEHLITVKKDGFILPKCPFRIKVDKSQVGDASKVVCSGPGISSATSQAFNEIVVDTTKAGYGGLSVSVEGPSKAEIVCKEAKNGVVKIAYKPSEPGVYAVAVKFADNHVKESPFNVTCTGKGAGSVTDTTGRKCEQAPIVIPGQDAVLYAKLPNTNPMDMSAKVMLPNGRSEDIEMRDLGECFYQLKFVPHEEGLHVVSILHKEQHVNGSPYQYTVGSFSEGGAHKVRAGGMGLVSGETVYPQSFNIFTREAGAGKLNVSIEGPSKAAMEFKDHKNGNCHLEYKVQKPGEYIVAVKFNDQHIPDSPFKVFIAPSTGEARKLELASFPDMGLPVGKACTFTVLTHRARGHLEAKVVSPSNTVETIDIVPIDEGESYAMRFIPHEPGNHYVHVTLDNAPMRNSPFRIRVGGKDSSDPTAVSASGDGLKHGQTGQKCEFIINTCNAGAAPLQVQIDGPSKVTLDAYELDTGYKARYTPLAPGDYYASVKYAGIHIPGSPFKINVTGNALGGSGFNESSMVKIDALAKTSKGTVAQAPTYKGDASKVIVKGAGLKKFFPGRPAMFTIDTNMAGPNLLFVGVVTTKGPCEEVLVKHHGQGSYIVNYKILDRTKGFIFVKYGEEQIPGSPFAVEP